MGALPKALLLSVATASPMQDTEQVQLQV